jgi:hypothetical protein
MGLQQRFIHRFRKVGNEGHRQCGHSGKTSSRGCSLCNLRKGNLMPQQARMFPRQHQFADGAPAAPHRAAVSTELSAR